MKTKFSLLLLVASVLLMMTGCFEKDNPLLVEPSPFTRIQFQVPDSNRVPLNTAAGIQVPIAQPSYDLISGRYDQTATNVRLQVNLTSPADLVEVYAYNTSTLAQELEASASSVSGSTTFTLVARHVGIGFNATTPAAVSGTIGNIRSVTLRVVTTKAGSSPAERIFTAQFIRR